MVLVNCAKDFVAPLKAYSVAVQLITIINDIKKNYLTDKDCREKYKNEPKEKKQIRAVSSFDPNEIVGPSGNGVQNYVNNQIGFGYTIYFENLKSATAPAQEVVILDTLDKSVFDFQSFSFGRITWGSNEITPLPNMKQFTIDVSLKPKNPNLLRINGTFDTATGIVKWHFLTLDSATMNLPENPLGGFLPPNTNPPDGEGSVYFTINLKKNLPHKTIINNQAVITFDVNPPIFTNVYSNQIDLERPASSLKNIYKISYMEPNFYKITGTATDDGSGVEYRTVFASINDGDYFPIATMKGDEIFIQLEPDSVYKFFSLAVDNVGNFEPLKVNYEISNLNVVVEEGKTSEVTNIVISPNPAYYFLNINCQFDKSGTLNIFLNNIFGQNVMFYNIGYVPTGNFSKELPLENISSGIYVLTIEHNKTKYLKIISVEK